MFASTRKDRLPSGRRIDDRKAVFGKRPREVEVAFETCPRGPCLETYRFIAAVSRLKIDSQGFLYGKRVEAAKSPLALSTNPA